MIWAIDAIWVLASGSGAGGVFMELELGELDIGKMGGGVVEETSIWGCSEEGDSRSEVDSGGRPWDRRDRCKSVVGIDQMKTTG